MCTQSGLPQCPTPKRLFSLDRSIAASLPLSRCSYYSAVIYIYIYRSNFFLLIIVLLSKRKGTFANRPEHLSVVISSKTPMVSRPSGAKSCLLQVLDIGQINCLHYRAKWENTLHGRSRYLENHAAEGLIHL